MHPTHSLATHRPTASASGSLLGFIYTVVLRKSTVFLASAIGCAAGALYALKGDHALISYAYTKIMDDQAALDAAGVAILALVIAKPLSSFIAAVLPESVLPKARASLWLVSFLTVVLICTTTSLARIKTDDIAKTYADTAAEMAEVRKLQVQTDLERTKQLAADCKRLAASKVWTDREQATRCYALAAAESTQQSAHITELETTLRKRGKTTIDVLGDQWARYYSIFSSFVFSVIAAGLAVSSGTLFREYIHCRRQELAELHSPTPLGPLAGAPRSAPGGGALEERARSAPGAEQPGAGAEHAGAGARQERCGQEHAGAARSAQEHAAQENHPQTRPSLLSRLLGLGFAQAPAPIAQPQPETPAAAPTQTQTEPDNLPTEAGGRVVASDADVIQVEREGGRLENYHREGRKYTREEWTFATELLPKRNPGRDMNSLALEAMVLRRIGVSLTFRNIKVHCRMGSDQTKELMQYLREHSMLD